MLRILLPRRGKTGHGVPRLTKVLVGLLAAELTLFTLSAIFPPDMTRARHSSPVVLDRRGAWLRALPVEDGRWRIRADLQRTDPTFQKRLIKVEDARFFWHLGVDPLSLARAIGSAVIHGRVTSGASTLTMQTARLLEPRPRTVGAKLIEMVRAVQLESRLSKREILALYLTLAPYGGNLEGARAASLSYFGHEPSSLTDGEQAMLIALPQSPEARRPDRRPEAAKAARRAVLDKMVRAGAISQAAAYEAENEPLPRRTPFPALAWHVAGELARNAPASQASVISTIDADLQARLEPMAGAAAAAQGPDATAAILVVEIKTRAVRAAVGSAGRDRAGGWVDMTRALRSPGSALKPFIYAMAMDDGLVAADTQLADSATRFADYQPENFDRVFHDKVTVREALAHSLNVPAVATLEKLGPETFAGRIEAAGAHLARPKAQLKAAGLALALGGEGITWRDLVMLYAALGDNGIAKPLAWTEDEAKMREHAGGTRLVRPEAARQVLDILREAPAPRGRAPSALTRGGPSMAFKTGTSYGFRDAVAAGVVGGYAMLVWTGRADGGARGGLTGRDAALPLLFDVADAVGAPTSAPRPIAPKAAPLALQKLQAADAGPRLIFPPDGASVQVDGFEPGARGLVLAAEGEGLTWYVEGRPLDLDLVSGRAIWKPAAPGFYKLSVIDTQGRRVSARVRIKGE
ncbi:penicillin-binding protein 1C [Caulobacter sp. RL271]|jgi:penicillin-binding protein 1C|uniref:peptidoglycan glycosyltransferase n=1 Tax=Caulobacter segnis TaxID=88688 RepID=A0ABY4ZU97_9CAUL|nr:penicillin-binding protein 1C [Caulobacter segnis]USQ96199.1 penicillin-binding protein 1C [Caulobacter segnis]